MYSGSTWAPVFDGSPASTGNDIAQSAYVTNNGSSTLTFSTAISGELRIKACKGSSSTNTPNPTVSLSNSASVTVTAVPTAPDFYSFGSVSGITTLTLNGTSAQGMNLISVELDGKLLVDSGVTVTDNSFHLDFSDNSTAAALGTDTSGNGNTWTVNNFSVASSPLTWTAVYVSGNNFTVPSPSDFADIVFSPNTSTSTTAIVANGNGTLHEVHLYPSTAITLGTTVLLAFGNGSGGDDTTNSGMSVEIDGVKVGQKAGSNYTSAGDYSSNFTGKVISQANPLKLTTRINGSYGAYVPGGNGVNPPLIRSDGVALLNTTPAGNDSLVDAPVNGSQVDTGVGGEVVGNYCTWNPLAKGANVSLSNGNLDASTSTTSGYGTVLGTVGMSSGQWYWEFTGGTGTLGVGLGIAEGSKNLATYLGADVGYEYYSENGNKYSSAGGAAYGSSWGSGDVIGVTFDADAGTLSFYKNGVSQGTAYTGLTNTPYFPAVADSSATNVLNGFVNFGQRQWAYAAPAGFKALCTTNLPEPTIADGSTAMDVALYTGNGSTQTISGLNFSSAGQTGLVWIKSRSSGTWHNLTDAVRGVNKSLFSNSTIAETAETDIVTALSSTGFTLGADANADGTNISGASYAAWCWASPTSTSTNTEGSITSQVRANASAGFSVVTFNSGNSDGEFSVGHGLGVAPRLIIMKSRTRSGGPWWVHHLSATDTTTKYLQLSTTSAVIDNGGSGSIWGAALPTSTVFGFSVGAGRAHTQNEDIVSYCFAPVAGYSSFGSYTGNGSTDGPFVYTGFRPRWILYKRTDDTGYWLLVDALRNGFNPDNNTLCPNLSDAEDPTDVLDILSNGFKLRVTGSSSNASGGTYIYYAVAENPFQYARAR